MKRYGCGKTFRSARSGPCPSPRRHSRVSGNPEAAPCPPYRPSLIVIPPLTRGHARALPPRHSRAPSSPSFPRKRESRSRALPSIPPFAHRHSPAYAGAGPRPSSPSFPRKRESRSRALPSIPPFAHRHSPAYAGAGPRPSLIVIPAPFFSVIPA